MINPDFQFPSGLQPEIGVTTVIVNYGDTEKTFFYVNHPLVVHDANLTMTALDLTFRKIAHLHKKRAEIFLDGAYTNINVFVDAYIGYLTGR